MKKPLSIDDIIKTKSRNSRIWGLLMILSAVLYAISMIAAVATAEFMFMIFSMFLCLAFFSVWMAKYLNFTLHLRWIKKKGMLENVIDNVDLNKIPPIGSSKIYCGTKAFCALKPLIFMPYSEIAWMHIHIEMINGITVGRYVAVHTKDGKKFLVSASEAEFKLMVMNYIIVERPDIILGFGNEQKKQYKKVKAEYRKNQK